MDIPGICRGTCDMNNPATSYNPKTILSDMTAVEGSREDFRCSECHKLLAKSNGQGALAAEIKCPRCGGMNTI